MEQLLSNKNRRFLIRAKNLCVTSGEKFQVGAIIVKGNRVMGMGINSKKTHPDSTGLFQTIHAEHQALINCGFNDLNGATAFVFRETKDRMPAMAKPCKSCFNLLRRAGISKVFFSTKEWPYWNSLEVR